MTDPKTRNKYTIEEKELAFNLWTQGKKYKEIAELMDIPEGTLTKWYGEQNWAEKIGNLKKELQETGIIRIISAGQEMLETTLDKAPVVHRIIWDQLASKKTSARDRKLLADTLTSLANSLKLFTPDLKPDTPSLSNRSVNPMQTDDDQD